MDKEIFCLLDNRRVYSQDLDWMLGTHYWDITPSLCKARRHHSQTRMGEYVDTRRGVHEGQRKLNHFLISLSLSPPDICRPHIGSDELDHPHRRGPVLLRWPQCLNHRSLKVWARSKPGSPAEQYKPPHHILPYFTLISCPFPIFSLQSMVFSHNFWPPHPMPSTLPLFKTNISNLNKDISPSFLCKDFVTFSMQIVSSKSTVQLFGLQCNSWHDVAWGTLVL